MEAQSGEVIYLWSHSRSEWCPSELPTPSPMLLLPAPPALSGACICSPFPGSSWAFYLLLTSQLLQELLLLGQMVSPSP